MTQSPMHKQITPLPDAKICLALTDHLPVLSVSDSIEALLGFSAEEFLTLQVSLKELLHPHDYDIAEILFSSDLQNRSGSFNIRLRQANGRIRCIKCFYEKRSGSSKNDTTLELLLQDAKSLPRTLDDAVSMANFRAIMENTDDYIYFKDRNHVFTGASQTLVTLCSPAEHWTDLIGMTDYDVFPEEYADIYYRLEKEVFAGVTVAQEIQEYLTNNGNKGWVDNRKYPIHDEKGALIGLYGIARDVTERKQMEKDLQESEERFRALSDASFGGVIIHDKGLILECNQGLSEMTGFSYQELIGMDGLKLIAPESLDTVLHNIRHGYEEQYEVKGVRKNGEKYPLAIKGKNITYKDSLVRVIEFRDITERKQYEQDYQRLFREMLDGLALHEIICDETGTPVDYRFLNVNPAFELMTGLRGADITGKTALEVIPDLEPHWIETYGKVALTGETVSFENYSASLGKFFYVASYQTAPGQFASIFTDITERKQTEEIQAALRRSQIMLARTEHIARLGGWEWDIASDRVTWSDELFQLFQLNPADGAPSFSDHHNHYDPDDMQRLKEAVEAAVTSGTPYEMELCAIRSDGVRRTCLARGYAEIGSENKVTRLFGSLQDITEQKLAEEQLLEANRQLEAAITRATELTTQAEAANRAKSEFLANMSHEIRTPMNGVIGMAQLLRFTNPTAEQADYLDNLELSCQNLLALINDILDLSKIESGKMELEYVDFSLQQSIQEVTTSQISLIRQKGLQLITTIQDQVPELLHGDSLRFKQILLNLLGNAIKFTETGTITISVMVASCQDKTCRIRLEVSDTGIGMTDETVSRIFNSFEQADNSTTRRFGGSGLGLSICRRLTQLMGGEISAESTFGKGSTFRIELLFQVSSLQLQTRPDRPLELTALNGKKGLKLLVAEDNTMNATTTVAMLKRLGHQAEVAVNGRNALELWHTGGFNAILMDIQMPVMDGCIAVSILREQEQKTGGHIPVIAMTAFALQGDRERFLAQGFDGYISKPVDMYLLDKELMRLSYSNLQ